MENFWQSLFSTLSSYELNITLRNPLAVQSSLLSQIFGGDEDREEEESEEEESESSMSPESYFLMQESLRSFLQKLIEQYPQLEKNLKLGVMTELQVLLLFCNEEGSRIVMRNIDAVIETARLTMGAEGVYIAEMDSDEPLTQQEINEVVRKTIEHVSQNPNGIHRSESTAEDDLSLDEEESYTLAELTLIAAERGLNNIPLSTSLCYDILDYLWEEEKDRLILKKRGKLDETLED